VYEKGIDNQLLVREKCKKRQRCEKCAENAMMFGHGLSAVVGWLCNKQVTELEASEGQRCCGMLKLPIPAGQLYLIHYAGCFSVWRFYHPGDIRPTTDIRKLPLTWLLVWILIIVRCITNGVKTLILEYQLS